MRDLPHDRAEAGRIGGDPFKNNGAFRVKLGNARLCVVASEGEGWDHVSVSLATRCPTWEEMCFVKNLFFDPHEVVMQLHPAESEYVNYHPFCLHLWRPQIADIPTPPAILVGPLNGATR